VVGAAKPEYVNRELPNPPPALSQPLSRSSRSRFRLAVYDGSMEGMVHHRVRAEVKSLRVFSEGSSDDHLTPGFSESTNDRCDSSTWVLDSV
jgi:hypothetical protein